MSAAERLQAALASRDMTALRAAADLADVPLIAARRAARGRPVSTDHHLRLCAAIGYDPYFEGRGFAPYRLGRFSRRHFGTTVRSYRTDSLRLSQPLAAKRLSLSVRCLSFIENGKLTCIDTTLAVCRSIAIHPFCFADRAFTGNSQCKGLNEQERSAA